MKDNVGSFVVLLGLSTILLAVCRPSQGSPFNTMDFDSLEEFGSKTKRPFCNAFTGCGRKRSDPDLDLSSDLDQEAEQIGEHMITGLSPMELMQTRKFGMSSLRPEGGQLGFFPGYLKRK
ncbi:hypothetical protein TCAL_08788 [Tigriopus californicus]|uniref:Crustacean cardioactive peptide n=1 Tax=Tigriopus californicus TaxID=6832 RepID=A0A553PG43_TIGCA|nr:cardioactive peptide-like [Tigriopus californicus]TRY76646.1 hypothetical protein TCAL_08788 [Tigriopus californicus]|eukprot:TCALIF_08788-PA protein Name:"Protein of unknown function" AED:0.00 eAED:0.00 QI:10/1/1/1/0.66/0.5/4/522/119